MIRYMMIMIIIVMICGCMKDRNKEVQKHDTYRYERTNR